MPLTRTSDGSLGVRAINSKSGNGGGDITYAPVYQITIQNDGQNGEIGPQAIKKHLWGWLISGCRAIC